MWAALRRWLTTPNDGQRRPMRPSYQRGGGGYRPSAGNASRPRLVTPPKPPPGPGGGSRTGGTGRRIQVTVAGLGERVTLMGGPYAGATGQFTDLPDRLVIKDHVYNRVDDPDGGEFLGAYVWDGAPDHLTPP